MIKEVLEIPFGEAIWPWMEVSRKRLEERAGEKLSLLSAQARLSMEIFLLKRWSDLCTPSMLLEMEIEKIGFSLVGSSSRERYLNFIEKAYLNKEGLASFFEEYKELARLVSLFAQFWENQAIEFLSRLEGDLPLLAEIFNEGKPLGKVNGLKLGAGDTHHEGSTVFLLTFAMGKELFYKPKNLNIVKNFNAYIGRLTELGLKLPLKSYEVLTRGEYGWEEKVEHKPCLNMQEVGNYFHRAGIYLCLLYLLDGTDVHFENIIASGEHPVFIDLETLFHSQLRNEEKDAAVQMFEHSVLATGLLPCYIFTKTKQKGKDISGLGCEGEDIFQVQWENINTDEMISFFGRTTQKYSNQVIFNNVVMRAKDHVEFIVSGFKEMYDFIKEKRTLLEQEGWYSLMKKDPVRILLRATRFYGYILQKLYEPKALLNKEEREEILSLLSRAYSGDDKRPEAIATEEKRSLLQGDIPCFNTIPSSIDLFSKHTLITSNCLEKPAIESVCTRLENMSEQDRSLQETFIRQAFHAKNASVHEIKEHIVSLNKENALPKDEEILLYVEGLATELRARSYQSADESLGWISLEPQLDTEQFQLTPMADTLYSGRAGVALFFAALSKISKNKKWEEEALNTLKSLRKEIHNEKGTRLFNTMGIGGMAGVGGVIYSLFQIGRILDLPSLVNDAKKLAYSVQEKHIQEDVHYDIISGSAGLVLALLSLFQYHKDPYLLQLAKQCGEFLCKKAPELLEDKFLLGFSHGAAGMAYTLLKLASFTNNSQFYQKAQDFLAFERSHYSAKHKNWPHFGLGEEVYRCAWCHGATGIGLSRVASLSLINDEHFSSEIDSALETTAAHGNLIPLNLCCGPLGRLEFLREASKSLSKSNLDQTIHHTLQSIFSQLKQENDTEDFYKPGFMQGKAGLGYTLLRLLDKEECLPQVLLLQ